MSMQAEQLLKNKGLRLTDSRKTILELFMAHPYAISHSYIENTLPPAHDRVTIYRTLNSFLEKGLIHKVLDEGGGAKYALCNADVCSEHAHQHNHIHFKCEKCLQTFCLDDVQLPHISLPANYTVKEVGVLVSGICKNCT